MGCIETNAKKKGRLEKSLIEPMNLVPWLRPKPQNKKEKVSQ